MPIKRGPGRPRKHRGPGRPRKYSTGRGPGRPRKYSTGRGPGRPRKVKENTPQIINCVNCDKLLTGEFPVVKGKEALYCSSECLAVKEPGVTARVIQLAATGTNGNGHKRRGRKPRGTPLAVEARLKSFWDLGSEYREGHNEILFRSDAESQRYMTLLLRGKEIARKYFDTDDVYISMGGWNTAVTRSRLTNVIGVPVDGDKIPLVVLENGKQIPIGISGWYNVTKNAVLQVTRETVTNDNFSTGRLAIAQ